MKKKIKIITVCFLSIITLMLSFNLIYNETAIGYGEPETCQDTDLSLLADKRCEPIFNIENNNTAIMLIHGYGGCPSELKYYAEKLSSEGFDIICPLLPGMGTTIDNLKKSYYTQWYNYSLNLYKEVRSNYDSFFLIGLSIGGTIALNISEEVSSSENNKPTAVITISSPVFFNNPLEYGIIHSPSLYFCRFVGLFSDGSKFNVGHCDEDGSYRSLSMCSGWALPRQGYSIHNAMKKVKANLYKIDVPVFLIHSKGDKVAPISNIYCITDKISSENIKMKIYDIREYGVSLKLGRKVAV